MKKNRILAVVLVAVMSIGLLAGCGAKKDEPVSDAAKKNITIGCFDYSYEIVESGIPALEAKGYEVEIMEFNDFQSPNRALDEGQIDCNFYQHLPFLNSFNSENGTDLYMIEPVMWNPFTGLYSMDCTTVADIAEGGKVGISNDPTNVDRALKFARDYGLIELTEAPTSGDFYTPIDIVSNPKNLTFINVNAVDIQRTRDEYDAYIDSSDNVVMADNDPYQYLLKDAKGEDAVQLNSDFALGVTVRAEDKDSQLAKDLLEAFTSQEAIDYVLEKLSGGYVQSDLFLEFLKK